LINAIAIDDEPLALVIIEEFCKRTSGIELHRSFTDWEEAARHIKKHPVDLLFLDIQMPGITGVDWYKKYGSDKMVIFTTAFKEYAVEGFNLSAIDYLLKPIEFERFTKSIDKTKEYYGYLHTSGKKEHQHLFVRSEYSLVKITFDEIEYIETLDDYLKIHTKEKKPILTKMNLKNVMQKLNPAEFIRVHRSYIVPMSKIRAVRGKSIQLATIEIPIGIKFEKEFFELFKTQ
jgi:DNA-binding LytR/AlgR family response regulator